MIKQVEEDDAFNFEGDIDSRSSLVRQVGKLLKERQKILRLHRKAEKKVSEILQIKEQNGEMVMKTLLIRPKRKLPSERSISFQDDQIKDDKYERKHSYTEFNEDDDFRENREDDFCYDDQPNWHQEMEKAKESFQEEDKLAEEEELRFRILLEEARAKSFKIESSASEALHLFTNYVNYLGKKSTKLALMEKTSEKDLDEALMKLYEASKKYITSSMQHLKIELKENQDEAPKLQIALRNLINLQMEKEAEQEELRMKETETENLSNRLRSMKEKKLKLEGLESKLRKKKEADLIKLENLKQIISQMEQELQNKRKEVKKIEHQISNCGNSEIQNKFLLFSDKLLSADIRSKVGK